MTARILSGQEAAKPILASVKEQVKALDPKLVIVQVGSDPASDSYIRKKIESCEEVHMRFEYRKMDESVSFKDMMDTITSLNNDSDVTGYIIQLPLPPRLQEKLPLLIREIDPYKDVDGFTAYNLGKLFLSQEFEHLPPATPAGIIALLKHYDIPVEGKHAVVIGHSNIVGKPIAAMLLNRLATVTICHEKTTDLAEHAIRADILVSAVGKPNLIAANMVKQGAVVIDVGITRADNGMLQGDVDFEAVKDIASAITPVPGGVGPMTVACLLKNCITARERQMEKKD